MAPKRNVKSNTSQSNQNKANYTAHNNDFSVGDNRFECLDSNCAINCWIYDDLISEKDDSFKCFQRIVNMHPSCFDPDLEDNIIIYLSKSSHNFHLIYHVYAT